MTNLDSIFKSRDITLPTKVRLVKAMVFPVVIYGCESWIVKKDERQRIDAFEMCIAHKSVSPLTELYSTDTQMGLKLNIQKTKIMASGSITSRQIDGETVETMADFVFGGSKITADGDCNHEIKRRLLLGRKVMTNLDSILKSRDITLPTKVCLVKAMVFPVVLY